MTPQVTAVVLNWCNEADTAACLESLSESRYDQLGVLLVDNGSPDESGQRLHARFPHVDYLQTGANLGYAGGNNRGIERAIAAGAEYVLVVNNDTVLDRDCISELVSAAQQSGAAVVAPQIRYFDEPERIWYGGGDLSRMRALGLHRGADELASRDDTRSTVTFVTGCCFLSRANVFTQHGAFDEQFFAYVEDAEWSVRLARAGERMAYEPRARVLHRTERGGAETPFQIRQRDRNRRRLVQRHYGVGERIGFFAWFYSTRAMHLSAYLLRGDWERARAIVDGALR